MKNIPFKLSLFLTLYCLQASAQTPTDMLNTIFPMGDKTQGGNFTGTVWVKQLLSADTTLNAQIGNVIFEPKARSKWHTHAGGQTLLVLEGMGYYQEKGKPLQILHKGDVARCPPDVQHWHGASHDHWFVQLAITPEHPKGRVTWLQEVSDAEYQIGIQQQQALSDNLHHLAQRHQHIVTIASFTTKGDLEQLKKALTGALNAGLTINEIKEVLVHQHAYCGFPRSIQALNTLMAVLEIRSAQGITDQAGATASPITDTSSKYERGKNVLETLIGQPQVTPPKSGYGAFSPEIDVFLKEHLFADLFGRDVLSYTDREIATISTLVNLGGVAPMMLSHMGIALNLGMTEAQLLHLLAIVETNTGKAEAAEGRKVLVQAMELRKK